MKCRIHLMVDLKSLYTDLKDWVVTRGFCKMWNNLEAMNDLIRTNFGQGFSGAFSILLSDIGKLLSDGLRRPEDPRPRP